MSKETSKVITFHIHTDLGECIVTDFNDGLQFLGLDQYQIQTNHDEGLLHDLLNDGVLTEFKVVVKKIMTEEDVKNLPEFEF